MAIDTKSKILKVWSGEDLYGEYRGLGISSIQYKVSSQETGGGLFLLEQTIREKGGPPRHIHHEQDEWFYAIERDFLIEIDGEIVRLKPGDSILAPRKIPHTWAYDDDGIGRMIIAFTPAGKMEAFFAIVTKTNAMPKQDPELWRVHGMEVVGPPLKLN
jgi:mannose-6-phosphate isomerase-like protein (cupin superfamily)